MVICDLKTLLGFKLGHKEGAKKQEGTELETDGWKQSCIRRFNWKLGTSMQISEKDSMYYQWLHNVIRFITDQTPNP